MYTQIMMKILKKHQFIILTFLILCLAIILRFPYLNIFPPSMMQDEVGIAYSAISIAETGKDEWGNSFPLIFKSFGDYKAPLHIYTTALLYKLIGWHEVLPRYTSAIQGVFIVLFGLLWIRKLFKSNDLGLMAGLILAITPWTIHLSRMGYEPNYGLCLFVGGLMFLSYANESKYKLVLSGIFFGLSTYTYHSYRYAVLLFFLSLIFSFTFLNLKKIKAHLPEFKNILLIFFISLIVSLPGFFAKNTTGRLNQTLLITSEKSIKLYEHYENNCHGTFIELNPKLTILCKLKYNKFTRPVLIGTDSFIKFLSPDFLFFSGDSDESRNPTQSGEFYVIFFPLWMIGALLLIKNYKKNYLLIVGYVVALLPAAMSGPTHAIRLTMLVPFALAVVILGYQSLKANFKNSKMFSGLFIVLLFFMLGYFIIQYMTDTFATHEITSTYLSYAKKVAILEGDYVKRGYIVYADHTLYPEPHIYYAYFNQIDPRITQESFAQVYVEEAGFSRPEQFGEKVFFKSGDINQVNCYLEKTQPTVYITKDEIPNLKPIKSIKDNTNLYAFAHVYEGKQKCLE